MFLCACAQPCKTGEREREKERKKEREREREREKERDVNDAEREETERQILVMRQGSGGTTAAERDCGIAVVKMVDLIQFSDRELSSCKQIPQNHSHLTAR